MRVIDPGGVTGIALMLARAMRRPSQRISIAKLARLLESAIRANPSVLVELKPAWLAAVRPRLLAANHTHATFTDLDIVWGRVKEWLEPKAVQPFDVTTWGFEGDSSRLFLRGQWTLLRISGPWGRHLTTRYERCTHLSTHLVAFLQRRLNGTAYPASMSVIYQQAGGGPCTTYETGRLISAEGCYSCVMLFGTPKLRILVRPVGFSDHEQDTTYWYNGELLRSALGRPDPERRPATSDWRFRSVASTVYDPQSSGALARFQTHTGANPGEKTKSLCHMAWVRRSCPQAGELCLPDTTEASEGSRGILRRTRPLHWGGSDLAWKASKVELLTQVGRPDDRRTPCLRMQRANGRHCQASREAPMFHFRLWEQCAAATRALSPPCSRSVSLTACGTHRVRARVHSANGSNLRSNSFIHLTSLMALGWSSGLVPLHSAVGA